MYASDALKYAYHPTDIGRCYRALGYYYTEENEMRTALALFTYSMEFDLSPMAYSEITHIKSKNNIEITLEESIEIIKNKNIQLGPNPLILETLKDLAKEYEENMLINQSIYFYELFCNLTNDKKTLEKINELKTKLNY